MEINFVFLALFPEFKILSSNGCISQGFFFPELFCFVKIQNLLSERRQVEQSWCSSLPYNQQRESKRLPVVVLLCEHIFRRFCLKANPSLHLHTTRHTRCGRRRAKPLSGLNQLFERLGPRVTVASRFERPCLRTDLVRILQSLC